MEEIRPIIKGLLRGSHAHIDPLKVIDSLKPELARRRTGDDAKSCWELLYHMWYWQDAAIRAYSGDESVKKANDLDSWPKQDQMRNDSDWAELVESFKEGLEQLTVYSESDDLMKVCEVWPDAPLIQNLMIEIAHNSYHLGQIVSTLKSLEAWQPHNGP